MPPKAGGGKPGALPAATGMKTMMSFFQKAPAASPPAEKKLAEAAGGADDAVNAILSPVVTGKADGSPGTASSGAKTADKAAMRENVEGVRRKRLLDSSDEEDEASGSGSGSNSKNINSTDSGVPGARGGSSLAGDAFAAAKAAKAGASVARVGQAVEVLRGGSLGGLAQWQRGSLVRQNISGRWKVAMDDGGNCEVTIPNENVRLISGSGASPAKSGGSPAKAPSAKSAPACAPTAPTPATAAPAKPGKRSCTGSKKRYIASSDEESVADGDDSDFKMGDADSSEEEEDDDAEMLEEDASGDEGAKTTQRRSQGKKSKAGAADKAAAEEQVRAGSKPVETTPKTKPAPSSTLSSPFIPKPVPSSVKSAFAAKACDQNTVSEAKKAKNDKFEAANKERYRWLLDIMDAKKRRPTDEGYDGRTLYIPQTAYAGFSNFEKQFWDIKKERFDMVLFFKKGKFYEMFEGDADIGHSKLHLKLTDRTNMRMCGIPEGRFAQYANQLVAMGYKVGRVEQMETLNAREKRTQAEEKGGKKSAGSKVCERELCQVLTQGTLTDNSMLEGPQANFLLSVVQGGRGGKTLGVCLLEASTGSFYAGQFEDDAMHTHLETLLLRSKPREVVYPKGCLDPACIKLFRMRLHSPLIHAVDMADQFWESDRTMSELKTGDYFGDKGLPELLVEMQEQSQDLAMSAVGGCVSYLRSCLMDTELVSMRNFNKYEDFDDGGMGKLIVDGQTLANLEILESEGGKGHSLIDRMDRCATAFGKRLFRTWVCSPLQDAGEINKRLDAVEVLSGEGEGMRRALVKALRGLTDVERGLSKVHLEAGGRKQGVMFDDTSARKIREFLRLLETLESVCEIQEMISEECGASPLSEQLPGVCIPHNLRSTLDDFKSTYGDLRRAADDGFITPQKGVYEDYDAALQKVKEIEGRLDDELSRCKTLLQCRTLSYWSPSAGKEPYQIEVPSSSCGKITKEFELKSQTKDKKRYWTPAVKELVWELTDAKEGLAELRQSLATRMLRQFDASYAVWMQAAQAIAVLDCLISLSYSAEDAEGPVCRPKIIQSSDHGSTLELKNSRHPCIRPRPGTSFVPNDIMMGGGENGERTCILTGPNMGGKSTILRQACVSVMMAQMGAYVPASECTLSPCDRIFTRIGANDRIIAGQSTFLVELSETSTILEYATSRSLVVLDELGRGTSTHDGYAIAHSVLHDLVQRVSPLLMFSTHYHNLTDELRGNAQVGLFHMSCMVDDAAKAVTFLHKLTRGSTSESYGLHCAQAAGLSMSLLKRAEEKKDELEAESAHQGLRHTVLFRAAFKAPDYDGGSGGGLQELREEVARFLGQKRKAAQMEA